MGTAHLCTLKKEGTSWDAKKASWKPLGPRGIKNEISIRSSLDKQEVGLIETECTYCSFIKRIQVYDQHILKVVGAVDGAENHDFALIACLSQPFFSFNDYGNTFYSFYS